MTRYFKYGENERLCTEEERMSKILNESLIYEILSVVEEIPESKRTSS